MTSTNQISGMIGKYRQLVMIAAGLCWLVMISTHSSAEDFISEFEVPENSLRVFLPPQGANVSIHEQRRGTGRFGGAEFIRFSCKRENCPVRIEHSVPPATVIDDLEASIWVKSNHDGFTLELKVTLPDVVNPETKEPLTFQISGDRYSDQALDQWQNLKCRTSEKAIKDKIRLLRASKQLPINPKVMYVDRVQLVGQLPSGEIDVSVDHLIVGPLVRFASKDPLPDIEQNPDAISSVGEKTATSSRSNVPVEFRLHRLYVEGSPFFPKILTYHQERPEILATAGINVAWLPEFENTSISSALRRQGIWITATPPYAKGLDGEPLDSDEASLLPFQANTSHILFSMLGTQLTPDGRPRISSWTNQIRDADRSFNRPIFSDVKEGERFCSRHVDGVGMTRHVINTNCSFAEYRDWLIQRRDQAWPDTFCWTWIQTEPVSSLMNLSRGIESPPMLEPEQIRLQVYAALAAGCRGIGYWTTTPLDHDSPAAKERLLAIRQLNLEIDLFSPWITSGGVPQLVSFKVELPRHEQLTTSSKASQSDPKIKSRVASTSISTNPATKKRERELHAAMIRSDLGALVLPMWLEDGAQFVPGSMAAVNVPITIPGGGETASAWEITTTGKLRYLDRVPAVGGVQIRLPRLDQTAAILMTTKQSTVDELNQKILAIQDQSARICVELARLKLERIREVDQTLQKLGVAKKDSWQLLGDAKINLDKAEVALKSQQPTDARQYAGDALQLGRLLQRTHWEHAVRRLPSPTSNPWAVSFQSLPEFWRTARQAENADASDSQENLLPSGEFEDVNTLVAERWKNEQTMQDTVDSRAELYRVAKQGNYSLQLSALPGDGKTIPSIIAKPPVTMISPSVSVRAGQVVRITGWAKIPETLLGSIDGALVYDSVLGKSGAIRLKAKQDWTRFELIRPVPESQELTVTLALNGLGEILFDDLRIVAFEPSDDLPLPATNNSSIAPTKYSPLDNLRRFNPLQKRP